MVVHHKSMKNLQCCMKCMRREKRNCQEIKSTVLRSVDRPLHLTPSFSQTLLFLSYVYIIYPSTHCFASVFRKILLNYMVVMKNSGCDVLLGLMEP